MMKMFHNVIVGLFCLFLISWIGALIKCEVLTHRHYEEFEDAYKQNSMLWDMEYFKVLEYNPSGNDTAQVYYVCEGHTLGSVLDFRYNHETDSWEEISYSVIWSGVGGSASEIIWPYWWHFIYGGI